MLMRSMQVARWHVRVPVPVRNVGHNRPSQQYDQPSPNLCPWPRTARRLHTLPPGQSHIAQYRWLSLSSRDGAHVNAHTTRTKSPQPTLQP